MAFQYNRQVTSASETMEIRIVFTPADDLPCPPDYDRAAEIANCMLAATRDILVAKIRQGMYPVGYSYRAREPGLGDNNG